MTFISRVFHRIGDTRFHHRREEVEDLEIDVRFFGLRALFVVAEGIYDILHWISNKFLKLILLIWSPVAWVFNKCCRRSHPVQVPSPTGPDLLESVQATEADEDSKVPQNGGSSIALRRDYEYELIPMEDFEYDADDNSSESAQDTEPEQSCCGPQICHVLTKIGQFALIGFWFVSMGLLTGLRSTWVQLPSAARNNLQEPVGLSVTGDIAESAQKNPRSHQQLMVETYLNKDNDLECGDCRAEDGACCFLLSRSLGCMRPMRIFVLFLWHAVLGRLKKWGKAIWKFFPDQCSMWRQRDRIACPEVPPQVQIPLHRSQQHPSEPTYNLWRQQPLRTPSLVYLGGRQNLTFDSAGGLSPLYVRTPSYASAAWEENLASGFELGGIGDEILRPLEPIPEESSISASEAGNTVPGTPEASSSAPDGNHAAASDSRNNRSPLLELSPGAFEPVDWGHLSNGNGSGSGGGENA